MCFVFLVKQHAALKWKDAVSGFLISTGSAETLFKWCGKIKHRLIAYFLCNTCARNHPNWFTYVKVIVRQSSDILRHSVYVCACLKKVQIFGITQSKINRFEQFLLDRILNKLHVWLWTCLPHLKNVTTVLSEMQNSCMWSKLCCFLQNSGWFLNSQLFCRTAT